MTRRDELGLRRSAELNLAPLKDMRRCAREETLTMLATGVGGLELTRALSRQCDAIVTRLINDMEALSLAFPARSTLLATGSFGAQCVCPGSDLDLLLLAESGPLDLEATAHWCGVFQTALRDVGFKVGMASRTLEQCLELAPREVSVATSMVSARALWGEPSVTLAQDVLGVLRHRDAGRDFAHEVRLACLRRNERFGRTVYLLEPDVKHGRGGLRDLQALQWSGLILYGASSLDDIARVAGARPEEVEGLRDAVDVVLRVRVALHLLKGKFVNDRLTFDLQEKIAALFGFSDSPGESGRYTLAVENFMRHFYSSAGLLARLCYQWQDIWLLPAPDPHPVILCSGLCVRQGHVDLLRRSDVPAAQTVAVSVGRPGNTPPGPGAPMLEGPGLDSLEESALERLRGNPISVYEVALEVGLPLHPVTEAHMARVALLVSDEQITPDWTLSLRRVLCAWESSDGLVRSLASSGLLVRTTPEFEPIVGLGKHDVYHVYTVEAHLLRALESARAMLRGQWLDEGRPGGAFFTKLVRALPAHRRDVWLLACLLHDVGKGRGGDHSMIGAALVGDVGPRLGLTRREVESLQFLVLEHLTLPRISQRRDLSDSEVIESVALRVRSKGVLDSLTLLAAVDMEAVGAQNLTPWKAGLLIELHQRVSLTLDKGLGPLREGLARAKAREALERCLSSRGVAEGVDGALSHSLDLFIEQLAPSHLLGFTPESLAGHYRVFSSAEPIAATFEQIEGKAATEVVVGADDQPGILSLLTGVLTAHGLNILGANINTFSSGRALDIFTVQTAQAGGVEPKQERLLTADLVRAVRGLISVESLLDRRRSKLKPRPVPAVETTVQFDQIASSRYTIVEVKTRDRFGLLWSISRCLAEIGCGIHIAKIVTEGERVIDVFYVEDLSEGRKLHRDEAEALRQRLLTVLGQMNVDR